MLVEVGWTMEPFSLAETNSSVPQEKFHVLVGVTGSVAALKLPLLVSGLLEIPGVSMSISKVGITLFLISSRAYLASAEVRNFLCH